MHLHTWIFWWLWCRRSVDVRLKIDVNKTVVKNRRLLIWNIILINTYFSFLEIYCNDFVKLKNHKSKDKKKKIKDNKQTILNHMCTLFHKYNKTFKKFICSIFKLNMSKAINLDTHNIFLEHMYINSIQQPVHNSWSSPRKEPIVSASSLLSSPALLMTFNYQSRNKITIQSIKDVTML